jgi:hypothetical protein
MTSPNKHADHSHSFKVYLQFISDMLGGDLFPLNRDAKEIDLMVSQRAIDYELIRSIVKQVQLHNAAFYPGDRLQAYLTLDALGKLRGKLLRNKGDIHQISLIDRIGELSVSFFNLSTEATITEDAHSHGRVYKIKRSR